MLRAGSLEPKWHNARCTLLPRMGESSKPNSWRPIAILRFVEASIRQHSTVLNVCIRFHLQTWQLRLVYSKSTLILHLNCKVTYKILLTMVYARLRGILEAHQGIDPTSFRPGTRLEDALLVFEAMCGKCLDWNAPLWFASFGLSKTFDRIEDDPLVTAQLGQRVTESYYARLWTLHRQQSGYFHDGSTFALQRGGKQGDVINLFCSRPPWNQQCASGNRSCSIMESISVHMNVLSTTVMLTTCWYDDVCPFLQRSFARGWRVHHWI